MLFVQFVSIRIQSLGMNQIYSHRSGGFTGIFCIILVSKLFVLPQS